METKIKGLLEKYQPIGSRYVELQELLESPEIIADNRLYLKLNEEKTSLEEIYHFGEALKLAVEMEDEEEINALYSCLTGSMLPKGNKDVRSAMVEIRLENPDSIDFAKELLNLYAMLSKRLGYKLNLCEVEEKYISFTVNGKGAYSHFHLETGVHRSLGGKVGNSNVWVTVLPQMDDVSVVINDKDLRTDVFHSSGAGGQNINKVATAIRLTHLPTGIVVVCKEERSQLQNRNRAKEVLISRLYNFYKEKELSGRREERRSALNRSRTERVRIVDFERETVSDLRTNQTISLKQAYEGGLIDLITPLIIKEERR